MSDVSCRMFEFFDLHRHTYGYTERQLLEGIDVDPAVLHRASARVPWAVWVAISERFEELVGGPDASIEAGAAIIDLKMSQPMQVVGRALLTPDRTYEAVVRWLGPNVFRNLHWRFEQLAPGHVVVEIEVPAGQPVSPAWFRLAEGSFVNVPSAVGGSPAIVDARVDGQVARFDIRCALRTTMWSRWRNRFRSVRSGQALLDQVAEMQADTHAALTRSISSERDLRRILSLLPEPVAVLRAESFVWANEKWLELLGPTVPGDVTELTVLDGDGPRELLVPGDPERILEVRAPVPLVFEEEPSQLIMLHDVTEQRTALARMRAADRLAALGTLAASVGHEINNPLGAALGSIELARLDVDRESAEAVDEHLRRAIDAIESAALITHDLLMIAREPLEMDTLEVEAVVSNATRMCGNELRHLASVSVDVGDDLPTVHGSASRITQVLINLLVNAAQALREVPSEQRSVTIRAAGHDDGVVVEVSDTGVGMSAETLQRVREPFFTTKGAAGSGLGLAVCEQIMAEHGSTLEITSAPGVGTSARFVLRAAEGVAPAEPTGDVAAATPTDGRHRILLIDDEVDLAGIVRALLEPHHTVIAHTAAEATDRLADSGPFDAILLDVMLIGEYGLDVFAQLSDEQRRRVVFMTGGVFDDDLRRQLDGVENETLVKPFGRAAVHAAVDAVAGHAARLT